MLIFKNKPDTSTPLTADNINDNFVELNGNIGDLSDLNTTNKASAVEGINSLKEEAIYNVSSSETKCNFKYDSKDVYCKTVSLAVPNNTSSTANTGINSSYTIVKAEIIARASNKATITIPYVTTGGFIRYSLWISGTQYVFELLSTYEASAYTAYATIYYIKE